MRTMAVILVVAGLVGGCAFQPRGGDLQDEPDSGDPDGALVADDDGGPEADGPEADAPADDAGGPVDGASTVADAATVDASSADAAPPADASIADAAPAVDASTPVDAAPSPDAGPLTELVCNDGADNDGDGAVDCRDDDCPSCPGITSCCASGACAVVCL